jgi:tRNA/rRNA methyltransferase
MTQPAIILVKPQLGENIGMVARAMLNCGLTDLRVISPRDGWPSEAANKASSGALAKGVAVTLYGSTHDALADLHYVLATTARPREMIKEIYTPEAAIKTIFERITTSNSQCGILFGGERAGLHNDDIALSHGIITVPLNPEFTSLNLAQAVLLLAYEWIKIKDNTADIQFHSGDTDIAPRAEVQNLVSRLEQELEHHNFFRSAELRPSVLRSITNLFSRMNITSQEVKTFHGIISALIGQKISKDKD